MKTKQLLFLILLPCLFPFSAIADTWQDPESKVNYVFGKGGIEAMVAPGMGYGNGSPDAAGAITILSTITVDGVDYSVTSIGSGAFYDCVGLTSITIPSSVIAIGSDAFHGCSGLTSVHISDIDAWCKLSFGNSGVSNPLYYAHRLYLGEEEIKDLVIPESVTYIGNYVFQSCTGLTSVRIGTGVTNIGNYAFSGCCGLASMIVEAGNTVYDSRDNCNAIIKTETNELISGCKNTIIPYSVTSIGASAFASCSDLTSVTIPNSVTSIGSSAFSGCSGLTSVISMIEEPFEIDDVFSTSTYNTAILYVPIGTIDAYKATDGWNNFVNIEVKVSSSLTLYVSDSNGKNLSDKVNITWYDADGKEIGNGARLNGIEDGTELYYSVTLDEEMGRVYREVTMQKLVAKKDEVLTCQLEKIDRVKLEGRVSATDIDKNTMTVSVRQMLNGKWEQTYATQTDEQGVFKVDEVYDDETDITISGDGYLNSTIHRDGFSGNGNVGTIPVNLISGFSIAANITMKTATVKGEEETTTAWTDGLNNIDFSLNNKTKGTAVTDFTVQNGSVIIRSGAAVGDEIILTAKSKQGIFADATTTFSIEEGAKAFDLQLTELGGVDATCTTSANGSTSGYLYNSGGALVAKGSYAGETLNLRHLPSGNYTLVSMGNSMLLGSMTQMADIAAVGLKEGTDYVKNNVTVADGKLAEVSVSDVPHMDDTRFYYTSDDTYFSANKALVTAGNYLTLQAHVGFKTEYVGKANTVTLTVDLPEGCEMVENSVIANRQAVPHTVSGNRVTMRLSEEQYGSQVRFCIIPTLNQSYGITAMAQFDIDGQVQQPIGIAQFETKGLSLSVVDQTVNTNITINGTAKGHSEVSIYDNDVLIGKTSSLADGSWTAQCELYKPYSHSFHDIYAKIVTDGGMELTSETRQVEYDKINLVPEKVLMTYYNGWYKKNIDVEFDLQNGTTSPSSYPFFSGTDFTFLADFTRNDTTVIKNVNIKVLNSDGTVRTLPAVFDGKQGKWVATTKYSSSSRLPSNVAVEYMYMGGDTIDLTESFNGQMAIFENCLSAVIQYAEDNYDYNVIEENDSFVYLDVKEDGETAYTTKLEMLDFSETVKRMDEVQFDFDYDEDGKLLCCYTEIEESFTSTTFVDFADSIAYIITIQADGHNSRRKAPSAVDVINWLTKLQNLGGIVNEAIPYLSIPSDLSYMNDLYNSYRYNFDDINLKTQVLLRMKCDDGSFKLSEPIMNNYFEQTSSYKEEYMIFTNKLLDYINEYKRKAAYSAAYDIVLTIAGGKAASMLLKCLKFTSRSKAVASLTRFMKKPYTKVMPGDNQKTVNMMSNVLGVYLGQAINAIDNVLNPAFADFRSVYTNVSSWAPQQYRTIMNKYFELTDDIEHNYKNCKKEDEKEEDKKDEPRDKKSDNKDDFKGNGTTPKIDPSGYVYEAVLSNRLEGVTATCYQKVQVEDMYGDVTEEAVVWNAADYSQVNPQKTDATGFYRWDVPQGMWQVKYEKEGYETAYSEWLPVPPPQLDVNIGMKQSTPPTVKQMRGYESGIIIDMSKYMLPATMNTANISATLGGKAVQGSVAMLNAEQAPLSGETYVQKVKFVPQSRFHVGDEVTVTVGQAVKSYCGVSMTQNTVQTVKIESEIDTIAVAEEVTVPYKSAYDLSIQVLPESAAAGKKLRVSTSSAMIASMNSTEVTINESGWAVVRVNGDLPGGAVLTFSIDGYDITATTKVKVKSYQKGDVNHDNLIDVADIANIIDLMAGCECIPSDEADVNGDGTVDVADIAAVIDIMAGQ